MKTELPERSRPHGAYIYPIRDAILEHHKNKIAFVILFGSFARGDWVYDNYWKDHIRYEYASDYDFLVVTKQRKHGSGATAMRIADEINQSLEKFYDISEKHTPTVIVESLRRVNRDLAKGHYFFTDIIKKDGILLYDSGEFELSDAKPLSKAQMKEKAEDYFEQWFTAGREFLIDARNALERNSFNISAFYLHQATENILNCALLVLTDYKPKLHDIKKLLKLCASQSSKFLGIFTTATPEERKCFKLLRDAYIGARYDKDYKITKEQLEYLIIRIENLRDVVGKVCKERINSLV